MILTSLPVMLCCKDWQSAEWTAPQRRITSSCCIKEPSQAWFQLLTQLQMQGLTQLRAILPWTRYCSLSTAPSHQFISHCTEKVTLKIRVGLIWVPAKPPQQETTFFRIKQINKQKTQINQSSKKKVTKNKCACHSRIDVLLAPLLTRHHVKSHNSIGTSELLLGLYTKSLKLPWISCISSLSFWVVLVLQRKIKPKIEKIANTTHHLQKLLYCPVNKGCLLWALAVWYLQTAAVFPFASFCPHPDSYKI